MNTNKNKNLYWFHSYKVVQSLDKSMEDTCYPTVSMEIDEQASIEDHLYAFERFLQSLGFVLPENSRLDFVENDSINDREDDIIKDPSNHKNNGVN